MAKSFHFPRQYQAKAAVVAILIIVAFQLPSSAPASVDDDDSLHPGPQTIGVGLPPDHKTLAQLNEAVRKAPTSATAYLARGDGYLAGSEMEKARADFNKALQIDPHCGRAHIGLYYVLCGSSHRNEALLAELKKAEKAGPP